MTNEGKDSLRENIGRPNVEDDATRARNEFRDNITKADSFLKVITILSQTPSLQKENGDPIKTQKVLEHIKELLEGIQSGKLSSSALEEASTLFTREASLRDVIIGHLRPLTQGGRKQITAIQDCIVFFNTRTESPNDRIDGERVEERPLDIDLNNIEQNEMQEEKPEPNIEFLTRTDTQLSQFLAFCSNSIDAGITRVETESGEVDMAKILQTLLASLEAGIENPGAPISEELSRIVASIPHPEVRESVQRLRSGILRNPQSYTDTFEQFSFKNKLLQFSSMESPTTLDLQEMVDLYRAHLLSLSETSSRHDLSASEALPAVDEIITLLTTNKNEDLRRIEHTLTSGDRSGLSENLALTIEPLLTNNTQSVQSILRPFVHKVIMRRLALSTIPSQD